MTSDGEINKASEAARSHPTDAAWSRLGDAFMQKARETMDLSYYARAEASLSQVVSPQSQLRERPGGHFLGDERPP